MDAHSIRARFREAKPVEVGPSTLYRGLWYHEPTQTFFVKFPPSKGHESGELWWYTRVGTCLLEKLYAEYDRVGGSVGGVLSKNLVGKAALAESGRIKDVEYGILCLGEEA